LNNSISFVLINCNIRHDRLELIMHWFYSVSWDYFKGMVGNFCYFRCSMAWRTFG